MRGTGGTRHPAVRRTGFARSEPAFCVSVLRIYAEQRRGFLCVDGERLARAGKFVKNVGAGAEIFLPDLLAGAEKNAKKRLKMCVFWLFWSFFCIKFDPSLLLVEAGRDGRAGAVAEAVCAEGVDPWSPKARDQGHPAVG